VNREGVDAAPISLTAQVLPLFLGEIRGKITGGHAIIIEEI
jgi:hypothetical protein